MGHLGKWHAQKIDALEDAQFVAVVDPSDETKSKLSDLGIDVPIYKTFDSLDIEFDAGIVATPTSLHFDICKDLLDKGKHVFCEKPVTSTTEQANKLVELCEEKGVTFQVGHSERFHSVWSKVKEKESYLKGSPLLFINRQAPFKGRATDVDVVQDLMIHDIDLLLFLLGDFPCSVKAKGKKMRTDKWDYVEATFDFKSGASAIVRVGRNYTREVRDLEISNEVGCLWVDLFQKKFVEASALSTKEEDFLITEDYEGRDHLYEEQKLFYKAILKNIEPPVTLKDGLRAVTLVEKVLRSCESGEVVQC